MFITDTIQNNIPYLHVGQTRWILYRTCRPRLLGTIPYLHEKNTQFEKKGSTIHLPSSTMIDCTSAQHRNDEDDNMNVSTATPNDALIHENIDGYQDIEDTPWSFTDVGRVPERSRDGSPHATDEVFNSGSHLAASMLSLLGTTLLVSGASSQGNAWKIVSFSIYGASLIFLFVCSTLHHAISSTPKVRFST